MQTDDITGGTKTKPQRTPLASRGLRGLWVCCLFLARDWAIGQLFRRKPQNSDAFFGLNRTARRSLVRRVEFFESQTGNGAGEKVGDQKYPNARPGNQALRGD